MGFAHFRWFQETSSFHLHCKNCSSHFLHSFFESTQQTVLSPKSAFQTYASSVYFVRIVASICSFAALPAPTSRRLSLFSTYRKGGPLRGLEHYYCCSPQAGSSIQVPLLGFSPVTWVANEMHCGIKLVSIRSVPGNNDWKYEIRRCTVLIFLAAPQHLKKKMEKMRSRSSIQYTTLSISNPYTQKPQLDVEYTHSRFSQTVAACTACNVTPLNAYSRKNNLSAQTIRFSVSAHN